MNVLVYSMLLTVFAFLLHFIVWRIHLPKQQTRALCRIFAFTMILGIFFMVKFPGFINWNIRPGKNFFEIVQFFLLFASVAVAYIVSYPAIEVDSPTLLIIEAVFYAGPRGLDKSRLEAMMNDELLIIPRIKDMLSDKMVHMDGERYKLSPKGILMARLFLAYRNMIRGTKGG